MAPRALETHSDFAARANDMLTRGGREIRYGGHHWTHAVVVEPDNTFTIRKLEYTDEERDAYFAKHRMFMPESAEQISKPRTVVARAPDLAGILALVKKDWPRDRW